MKNIMTFIESVEFYKLEEYLKSIGFSNPTS